MILPGLGEKPLQRLLWAGIAIDLVAVVSSLMQYDLLGDPVRLAQTELAEANDRRELIVGGLYVLVFVATAIFFGRWIVRAHRAVRTLGAEGMSISPGWAVGYFFIPLINLVRPYTAMKQLWQASGSPRTWASEPVSSQLPVWWALWIFSNILGNIAMRWQPADLEGYRDLTMFNLGSSILSIVLAFAALRLVKNISDRIAERAAEEPPPLPDGGGADRPALSGI
jgi:hypothetical protein